MYELRVIQEETVTSTKYEGVSLVLKPITVSLRAEVELATAGRRAELYELQVENRALRNQINNWVVRNLPKDANDIPETVSIPDEIDLATRRHMQIREQIEIITNGFVYPAWIKIATRRVEGVIKAGVPATPQDLVDMAPVDMIKELGEKIYAKAYMSAEEQENLKSPTTSGVVDGGQSQSTPVTSASPVAVPPQEIAAAIFQKTLKQGELSGFQDSITITQISGVQNGIPGGLVTT